MTGNKNAWRAPLAGLASLAMVATMGVAASTANAAPVTADIKVTFVDELHNTKDELPTKAYNGETLADVNGGYGRAISITDDTVNNTKYYFGGWTVDGVNPVDWNTAITKDTEVKALWLTNSYGDSSSKSDLAEIDFAALNSTEQLPAGNTTVYVKKDAQIPAALLPVDRVDGHVTNTYKYVTNTDATVQEVSGRAGIADVTTSNATVAALKVTFQAPTADDWDTAYEVTVDGTTKAVYGYVTGAKSDRRGPSGAAGTASQLLVDVPANTTYTVPSWFTVPQSGELNQTVTSWTDATHNNQVVGTSLLVNSDTTLVPSAKGVTKGYTVTYLNSDGTLYETVNAKYDSVNKHYFAVAPSKGDPTLSGYKFAGWIDVDGKLTGTVGKVVTAKDDVFANTPLTSNITLKAKFDNRDTTVKVTFKDAVYDGSHKSETVEVKVPGTLERSQTPQWTREGYTLAWYKSFTEYNFDEWITDGTANFTLTAVWTPATADKALAALKYVMPSTYQSFYQKATSDTTFSEYNYGRNFTDGTWAAYEKAYKPILEKYLTEVYNNPNTGVQSAAAAEIINDLNGALAGLKFKSNSDVASPVYRLRTGTWDNGRHHLWTTDKNEVDTLTKTTHTNGAAGWILEDTAFTALNGPKTGTKKVTAKKYATAPEGVTPIAKAVYRLNSDITKEHLYTVSSNEYSVLGERGWQQEDVAFYVPTYNGTDVYRFYTPSTLQHVWTRDLNEYNTLTQQHPDTYQAEGVAFKAL